MAAPPAPDPSLRGNPRFVRFVGAKLLQLLAQNALIYGLFILVVGENESALATSAFVLTAIIPSILLSVPGGVTADAVPVKLSLLATMAARVVLVWLFVTQDPGIAMIILLTLAWWAVSQFFSPAESAALPSVVSVNRIPSANALLDAVSLGSQLAGAGLIAPFVLKAFDSEGLFIVVLILLLASTVLYALIARLTPVSRTRARRVSWLSAMPRGLRIIRSEAVLLRVTTLRVLLDTGLTVVAVAAPTFINDILSTAPENAIYIFAPGAVGIAAGLVVAPVLLRIAPAGAVATLGFGLLVGVILTLPFIREVSRELDERTFLPLQQTQDILRIRPEIAATVLLLPFGGLGVSLVRVAARTAVYRHAPAEAIAQVFATQSAVGSIVSPLPTVFAGLLVDSLDVRAVLILAGSAMAVLAFLTIAGPAPVAPQMAPPTLVEH